MRRYVLLTLALALLAAGCGSTGQSQDRSPSTGTSGGGTTANGSTGSEAPVSDPIDGCVPVCNTPGLSQPGPLSSPYETAWFFGGEMIVSPVVPWSSHEDSTGEFALELDATPENIVVFWEDVYPVEHEKPVRGVPMTADGLLDWMRSDPRLDVSKARRGSIGGLPATVADVSIAEGAKNDDPGCPTAVCALFLGFPQWDGSWGIAEPQVQRFYLSDVEYGGETHLFVAVVYPDDPADMTTFLPEGEALLETVQVPAEPA
jgi:hypothetical protein